MNKQCRSLLFTLCMLVLLPAQAGDPTGLPYTPGAGPGLTGVVPSGLSFLLWAPLVLVIAAFCVTLLVLILKDRRAARQAAAALAPVQHADTATTSPTKSSLTAGAIKPVARGKSRKSVATTTDSDRTTYAGYRPTPA